VSAERVQHSRILEHQCALRDGHHSPHRILVREFTDAADEFLRWVEVEHCDHRNTYRRVAISFTSLKSFFSRQRVGLVDDARMKLTRSGALHDRLCERTESDGVPLKLVLYDFRRTFATRLAQAGVDLATLAAILGLSSIRIVQRHVHPTAERKRNAMLRYDEILKADKKRGEREGRPN
jgi:integrase